MSSENKTELPTEKKLHEATEKGQFARTPEIQAVAGLFAIFAVILFAGKGLADQVAEIWIHLFAHLHEMQVSSDKVAEWTRVSMMTMLSLSTPMLVVTCTASVGAGLLQSKFTLAPKALGFKWERVSPAAGFGRLFSKDGLMKLLVDSLKLATVGGLLWSGASQIFHDPIFSSEVEPARLGGFIYDTTLMLLFRFGLALGAIAAINYFFQRHKIGESLMMTREEVKEEHKSAEGDPIIRNLRRQMARRMLQKQMLSAVATADVVITNPTHFAVALKYERGIDQAPVILAKGENAFARRIKALAAENGVPMVENKPVARMLFKFGKVGEAIPMQLFQAVAEILGFVYRTHRLYFHELKQRRLTA